MKKLNIKKIFLIYSVALCLFFILFSSFNYYSLKSSASQQFKTANQTVIGQTKRLLDMKLKNIDKVAQMLVVNRDILEYIEKDFGKKRIARYSTIQKLLESNIFASGYIDSIYIYSQFKNELLTDKNISKADAFYDLKAIEMYNEMSGYYGWFGVRKIKKDGVEKEVITLIRRFSVITNSNYQGACIINLDISVIKDELANSADNEDKYCILNSVTKEYVYSTDGIAADDSKNYELLSALDKSNSETFINNEKVSIYMEKSDYNTWCYYLVIPQRILFNSIIMNVAGLLLITFIVLILIFFLYKGINAKTIKPVSGFIQSMNEYIEMIDDKPQGQFMDFEKLYKTVVDVYVKQKKRIEDSLPVLKWNLFMDILNGNKTTYESVEVILHEIGTEIYSQNYIVSIIEVDEQIYYFQTMHTDDVYFMFDALFSKAETLFNRESMKSFITKMADDRIAVVSSFKTSDVNENYIMLLMSAEQLKNEMNSNFNEKITIAIGGAYEQFKNIPLSYREAEYVLEYKFIMGTNSIICIEDIRPNDSGDVIQITNRISQIKNKRIDSIRQEIIDIFEIIKEKHLQPETARQLATQIIFSLFQIIDNMEEKITQKEREDFTGAYYVLEKKETLAEIEQYTLSLISMLEEAYKIEESSTNNDILIESFTSYIKENYRSNDMSLEGMAEKAGMSVSQFNRRFKASTGMTFLNFLICIRIEKAKELLAHTDFDYEEITREVGYIDSRSFIRMFKKMTGITAGEYRARHKK